MYAINTHNEISKELSKTINKELTMRQGVLPSINGSYKTYTQDDPIM